MSYLYLSILLLSISCSRFSATNGPIVGADGCDLEAVSVQRQLYLQLEGDAAGDYGFNQHSCDSLLFTSLQSASGGSVDVYKAMDSDGRWWRTPSRDCLSSGRSKSTISGDMLLGVAVYAWAKRDLQAIDSIVDYGDANSWIMGEHDGSLDGERRVNISPSLRATFRDLRHILEGSDKRDSTPHIWTVKSGFQAHLQTLHMLLRGYIDGGLSDYSLGVLEKVVELDPSNALYHAVYRKFKDGDQSTACELLDEHFPKDRLPTSADYCSSYRYQHGNPKDWEPCPDSNLTHMGTDFNLTATIILGELDHGYRLDISR